MIIDRIENCSIYNYNELFIDAFKYLYSLREFPSPGRYKLSGDDLIVNVDRYRAKNEAECRFEAHREYIDIQYIYSGEEKIKWHPVLLFLFRYIAVPLESYSFFGVI